MLKTNQRSGFLILVLVLSTVSFIALYHYHKARFTGHKEIKKEVVSEPAKY